MAQVRDVVGGDLPFAGKIQMRVVVSPVIVDDRICRIVAAVESLLEVEEWAGGWWEPSGVTLTAVGAAPAAAEAVLRSRGVPIEDCVAADGSTAQRDIQALLMTRDPDHSQQMRFDDDVARAVHSSRRRKYPGNARFRRGTLSATDSGYTRPERRRKNAPEWRGPWRRASDLNATDSSDDV